ncbi:MAG: peptide ABC transporter substrate-binding protein, partial [Elusimicrobiota bacterium]
LLLTAFITYMPVHEGCIKQHGIHWTKPGNIVTNGAFSLKTHLLNRKMRLVKSRTYWNHSGVRLKIIDVMPMESNNTAFNTYESGGADFSSNDLPVTIQEIMNKRSDYHNDPWLGTYLYRFNVTRPPFNDVRVRKAMNMCINREYIVKYITRGGQRPTTLLVPPSLPGYKSPPEVPYNTDSARSLLSQAGYANGINFPKTELLYNTFEHHKMIAEAVCHMWKKELGITVIPVNKEWKVLLEDMKNMNFSIIRGSWIGDYPDPNTFIDMFVTNGGNNNTGWGCPLYDSLVFSAAREADNIKRMEIFRQAEYILIHEGVCIMPIYFYVTTFLYRSNIHGIYPNPLGYIYLPCIWKES